ncbi:MAG: hypothetical protein INR65_01885 [Gluconacetobacter diazotrophicus]|nr:hypothetical protein [Gluconacetobacter diazotrophicus]
MLALLAIAAPPGRAPYGPAFPIEPVIPIAPVPVPDPDPSDRIGSWTAVDGQVDRQPVDAPSRTAVDPPCRNACSPADRIRPPRPPGSPGSPGSR